jgi:NAD-dependent deacetylase
VRVSAPQASESLAQAKEWLAAAHSVAVLTGAGISAESGVPTFRGPGGLWREFRPEDLATPEAFARDPRLVWEWYDWRRSLIARAQPNAGHRALAALQGKMRSFQLITQNVDDLHERAGSWRVIRLHGNIWQLQCLSCGRKVYDESVPLDPLPPRCTCGGLMRPAVVWFGEPLPADAIRAAVASAQRADVFLVVGTSSLVYPASSLPRVAYERGTRVIEVNVELTELTPLVHISLQGKSGEVLPQLIESLG